MKKTAKKQKKLPWWDFVEPEWHEYAPEQTGLPVTIWVDCSGFKNVRSKHYIRFSSCENDGFADQCMVICKKPYIPGGATRKISKDILSKMTNFVSKNWEKLRNASLYDERNQGVDDFEKNRISQKSLITFIEAIPHAGYFCPVFGRCFAYFAVSHSPFEYVFFDRIYIVSWIWQNVFRRFRQNAI